MGSQRSNERQQRRESDIVLRMRNLNAICSAALLRGVSASECDHSNTRVWLDYLIDQLNPPVSPSLSRCDNEHSFHYAASRRRRPFFVPLRSAIVPVAFSHIKHTHLKHHEHSHTHTHLHIHATHTSHASGLSCETASGIFK